MLYYFVASKHSYDVPMGKLCLPGYLTEMYNLTLEIIEILSVHPWKLFT